MELGLKGKVAEITGGSEGVGKATVLRLAQEGAKVAFCARRDDLLQETAAAIRAATGAEVHAIAVDVQQPGEPERFIAETVQRFGRLDIVVNITHVGAKQPRARSVPTSVSRAAGIALTKALSKELAEHKILVNTVCVGLIWSGQWESRRLAQAPHETPAQFERWVMANRGGGAGAPLGRMGQPEEVADLIAFLASERGSYITATAINVDAGLSGAV